MSNDFWAKMDRQAAAKVYEDKLSTLAATIAAGLVVSFKDGDLTGVSIAAMAVKLAAEIMEKAKADTRWMADA